MTTVVSPYLNTTVQIVFFSIINLQCEQYVSKSARERYLEIRGQIEVDLIICDLLYCMVSCNSLWLLVAACSVVHASLGTESPSNMNQTKDLKSLEVTLSPKSISLAKIAKARGCEKTKI